MHIAICDDNIADRKQTERLLGRESDRRAKTESVLYIDSFGKQESVLVAPMIYDMFFIDMIYDTPSTAADIVKALINAGVTAPIVMLCSNINYREDEYLSSLSQVHFLDKPIKVSELTDIISMGFQKKSEKIPTIELRTDTDVLYVQEKDIMYAVYSSKQYTDVFLCDGRKIHLLMNIENFYAHLEHFRSFIPVNKRTFVQKKYVNKISLLHVHLSNGKKFFFPSDYKKNAKTIQLL